MILINIKYLQRKKNDKIKFSERDVDEEWWRSESGNGGVESVERVFGFKGTKHWQGKR